MKIVILLFAFVYIFLHNISCNMELLSKFHQTSFKIKDVRIELVSYDKTRIKFLEVLAFKYNRTTTAHNGSVNFKVKVEDKLEVLVQGYKFLSNEYRHFPIRFQVNFKKCIDTNAIGLASLKNCGNFSTFYFYKDITYYACNFVVDEAHFPPLIPNGKYKWGVQFLYLNREMAVMDIFHEIYTPIDYPKD